MSIVIYAEGYLINREDWIEQVFEETVMQQVEADHVKLTETYWGLALYFRDYYEENKVHPAMHKPVKTSGKQHGEHFHDKKAYAKFLYGIFPHGPVQVPCKLAGLAKSLGDAEQ